MTIDSAWLGVERHRGTAPPGLPSTLCRCSELVANVTPFRRNRSPKINQQIPSTCAPSNFVRSVLPFVTTTRGSSECRPDDKAEATSRFVVLCDVKQGPQGFVADPKKPATIRAHSCRVHVRQGLCSCESEPCSSEKKAGRFRVLTYLASLLPCDSHLASWCCGALVSLLQGALASLLPCPSRIAAAVRNLHRRYRAALA